MEVFVQIFFNRPCQLPAHPLLHVRGRGRSHLGEQPTQRPGEKRQLAQRKREYLGLSSSAVEPHPGCRSPDEGRPTECRSLVSQDPGAAAPEDLTECRSLVSQDSRVPQPR